MREAESYEVQLTDLLLVRARALAPAAPLPCEQSILKQRPTTIASMGMVTQWSFVAIRHYITSGWFYNYGYNALWRGLYHIPPFPHVQTPLRTPSQAADKEASDAKEEMARHNAKQMVEKIKKLGARLQARRPDREKPTRAR